MHNVTNTELKKYRKEHNLFQDKMGELLGISREMYNRIENGKDPVSKYVALAFEKIKSEKKSHSVPHETPQVSEPNGKYHVHKVPRRSALGQIPYYDVDFAAGTLDLENNQQTEPTYYMDVPIFSGCMAFNVYSDSMDPILSSGNIMFCTKLEDWQSHLEFGQIYAVTMSDGRRYLKYIRKGKDDKCFLLRSENAFYEDFEVPKSKIKSVWLINGWMNKNTQ